ncbi:phage tail assembly protein [uncultured Fibrobacter sp.]|uniref:phage tail assembly protein n=1 Tax=uncultured Fibrobacter sp. TaxID=261512 RepID=UPI00280462EA|nr:phage tail assembly protein [uncultured Fibrobacter sp.]
MEYTLKVPVKKVTGEEILTVTVKESFTGRDIETIGNEKGEGTQTLALVAAATGLSMNTVRNMDFRDVAAIGNMAKPFLSDGEA